MRGVIQSGETVCHGVYDAEADIREAHACNVLTERHALSAGFGVLHRAAQVLGNQANGFKVEHIGNGAGALRDVALNGVGQSIHTGRSGQTLRHGGHHIRVNNRDLRDVVRVYADELSLLLHVGDNVVDCHFRSGTGSGRHCNGEHRVLLRRRNALQRANVCELRVLNDDADGLCGIHGGAAANGHDAVCAGNLEGLNAVLYVLNRRVRLDLAVNGIREAGLVQKIRHLLRNAELQKVRVRANKSFFVAARLKLLRNLFNRTLAVIRNCVQYDSADHKKHLLIPNMGIF